MSKFDISKDHEGEPLRNCQNFQEISSSRFDLGQGFLGPNLVLIDDRTGFNHDYSQAFEDQFLIINIPYSFLDKRIMIIGQFYHQALAAFGIYRLNSIKQFTQLFYYNPRNQTIIVAEPYHTRFFHTLVASVIMEVWMRKKGYFSELEIKKGILLALLHDAATSAFGDMMKYFHKADFDEEKNIGLYIKLLPNQESITLFCQKYDVDLKEIISIISGKKESILWKVFSWIDRVAYTVCDYRHLSRELFPLYEFPDLEIKPRFGDCFLDLDISNDHRQIECEYSENLTNFLFARAMLAKEFYFSPESRIREIFLAWKFNYFYPQHLSKEDLLIENEHKVTDLIRSNPACNIDKVKEFFYLLKDGFPKLMEKIKKVIKFHYLDSQVDCSHERLYLQQANFKSANLAMKTAADLNQLENDQRLTEIRGIETEINRPTCYYFL